MTGPHQAPWPRLATVVAEPTQRGTRARWGLPAHLLDTGQGLAGTDEVVVVVVFWQRGHRLVFAVLVIFPVTTRRT